MAMPCPIVPAPTTPMRFTSARFTFLVPLCHSLGRCDRFSWTQGLQIERLDSRRRIRAEFLRQQDPQTIVGPERFGPISHAKVSPHFPGVCRLPEGLDFLTTS